MRIDTSPVAEPIANFVNHTVLRKPRPLTKRELRKRVNQAERTIDATRDNIEQHRASYREELLIGSQSEDPSERRVHAIRARFEKFKARVQEVRRMKSLKDMSQLTVALESLDIEDMVSEIDDEDVNDSVEMQSMIETLVMDLQADLMETDDVMGTLDMEMPNVGLKGTEEEALMEQLALDQVRLEDLDIQLESIEVDDFADPLTERERIRA
jgi:hypothetical protein